MFLTRVEYLKEKEAGMQATIFEVPDGFPWMAGLKGKGQVG